MAKMIKKLIEILKMKPYSYSELSAEKLADHLLAHGVTVLEWIPAENPPKQDGKYLVAIINGGRFEISTRRYRVNPPKYQGPWARNTCGVRFWAELPKPPEVET